MSGGTTARARLLVLAAAVCFGTTGTAQALGAAGVDAVAVGAARGVLGGALLAGLGWWAWRRDGGTRAGAGGWALVAVGALGVAAYQAAFFAGVRATGVAVGTLVALGSAPLATGLGQWLVLGRRPTPRWALATAVAVSGVAVLALAGAPGRVSAAGVLAALGAGASYALYTLAGQALLQRGWAPDAALGAVFGGGAVLLLPVLAAAGAGWLLTGRGAATAAFLAIVPTALAYALFARGLRRLGAAEVSTLTLAEPVTAALLAVLVLAEPATAGLVAGAALLLAGLALLGAAPRAARRAT